MTTQYFRYLTPAAAYLTMSCIVYCIAVTGLPPDTKPKSQYLLLKR